MVMVRDACMDGAIYMCHVRLADKPWLKELLADLL